ncbi:MAG: hypothetical protein QXS27_06995, partial [Candidatus Jordarchaeaceae archaeon]
MSGESNSKEIVAQQRPEKSLFDRIWTLAYHRGFVFPSAEIYGGIAGIYDLGPLGAKMKNNLVQ